MQNLLVLMAFLLSLPAYGIDTQTCPEEIQISYKDLIPMNAQRLERLRRNPEVYETAAKAYQTILRTQPEELADLNYKYTSSERGVCIYKNSRLSTAPLQIYTRQGSDYLRVTFPLRGVQIYTTHVLKKVSESGVQVKYKPVTPLFVKAGTSSYQIGWAYSVNLRR